MQPLHKNVEQAGLKAQKSALQTTGHYHVFYTAFIFRVFAFAFSAAVWAESKLEFLLPDKYCSRQLLTGIQSEITFQIIWLSIIRLAIVIMTGDTIKILFVIIKLNDFCKFFIYDNYVNQYPGCVLFSIWIFIVTM